MAQVIEFQNEGNIVIFEFLHIYAVIIILLIQYRSMIIYIYHVKNVKKVY